MASESADHIIDLIEDNTDDDDDDFLVREEIRDAVDRLTISLDRNRIGCIGNFTWNLQRGHMNAFRSVARNWIRSSIFSVRSLTLLLDMADYEEECIEESCRWFWYHNTGNLASVRAVTTHVRPAEHHGCPGVEIIPGLWTARFDDIKTIGALRTIAPAVTLVVNVGPDDCIKVSYGKDVRVVAIDLLDDPLDLKEVDALPNNHPGKEEAK
jgi:hypothetical protein